MKEFHYTYNKPNKNIYLEQYVYRIGSYHYNWHNDLELFIVLSGEVEVSANGVSRILETDDIVLINPNVGHATLAHKPDSTAMVMHIDPVILKDYYENIEFLSFDLWSTRERKNEKPLVLIREYLSKMMLYSNKNDAEKKLLFESSFYGLLHTVVSYFPPKKIQSATFKVNQRKFDAINKMIKYINKNFKRKITLDKLAKESGYNSGYVSQLFKSYLGINFYEYLTRVRLREATRELSRSENKILDIALEYGFPDMKAFTSTFKETFGKSPTEYRSQLSNENRKTDINFKRQFVSVENEAVYNKLMMYISNEESSFPKDNQEKNVVNSEKMIQMRKFMEKTSLKLKQLTEELAQTTDSLDKGIKDLT